MSEGKHAIRARTIFVLPLLALVAAALFLTMEQSSPREAEAGGPGMNLTAPVNVLVNQTFVVTVTGSPLPAAYSGYSTEIVLPTGLKWIQRVDCYDEIGVTRLDNGQDPASCIRAAGPGGEPRHVVISAIVPPPQPALTGAPLLSIDVRCNTAGSYKIALTAVPDSSFGAVYFAPDTNPINVTTISQDINGDTTAENIADGQVVTCAVPTPAPPTNTPTATFTRTPTATPCPPGEVPAPGGGCAVPTATNTPSPTPTPLPPGTEVVLSGPESSPPGGAVDVTANVSDVDGNALPGVTCVFTIVEAPEGSEASLDTDSAVTDAEGNATVSLNVGDVAGPINVQADCGGVASQVLAVEVLGGVTGPPTGDSDSSAGTVILWALMGTALAAGIAGLGFAGWKKAAQRS